MRHRWRQLALWIGCVALVSALAWIAVAAPNTVPGHIGVSGEVTRWESRDQFVLTAALIGAGLVAMFVGLKWLIGRAGSHLINLPSAAAHTYWTSAEHRPEFNRRMRADLDLFCGATLLLLAVTFLGVVGDAAQRVPVELPAVGIYLAFTIGYCLYMAIGSRYKVPTDDDSAQE